jgi:DNA modification methylase
MPERDRLPASPKTKIDATARRPHNPKEKPPAKSASKDSVPPKARASSLLDTRVIYCGDNIDQLDKFPEGCVDLIYIDPPFNSNRNYEVFWGESKEKRSFDDRHASTQAYIDYMRPRCQKLKRVLKQSGSFYYHCDWHASHYVKVMLDQMFGENNFQGEVIWKRTHAHGSAQRWAPIHDSIFFYTGGGDYVWANPTLPHDPEYIKKHFKNQDSDGRLFQPITLTGSGTRNGESGKPWRHVDPTKVGRHWAIPGEVMERYRLKGETVQNRLDALDRAGLVYWPKDGEGTPRLKWYADELGGMAMGTVWTDIAPISANASERLGYPTQKPLALLERIIAASSNPNDIVLDAFCGCGTALVAAQNLGRQWIGIDISPTACRVMAKRLRDVNNMKESEPLWKARRNDAFVVRDLPWTLARLKELPPFEFENWAVIALGGIPNIVQVGDMGIDGRLYPPNTKPSDQNSMFAGDWFPIQVKQSDRVGRPDIDSFEAAMQREDRSRGFFVAFGFSSDAIEACAAFFRRTKRVIKLITVQEILDEQHVQKM